MHKKSNLRLHKKEVIKDHVTLWISSVEQNELIFQKCCNHYSVLLELGSISLMNYASLFSGCKPESP